MKDSEAHPACSTTFLEGAQDGWAPDTRCAPRSVCRRRWHRRQPSADAVVKGQDRAPTDTHRQARRSPPRGGQRIPPDGRTGRRDRAHRHHPLSSGVVFTRPLSSSTVIGTRAIRPAARARDAGPRRGRVDSTTAAASQVAELGAVPVAGRHRAGGLARGDVRVDRGDVVDDAPECRPRAATPRL